MSASGGTPHLLQRVDLTSSGLADIAGVAAVPVFSHCMILACAVRTTNLPERLFVGERRRLKLKFGAMIRASERWRSVRITHFERFQMESLRKDFDREFRERNGPVPEAETAAQTSKLSGKNLT